METRQADSYVPEDSLLKLTDISVRYGVVNALDAVSLGVRDGEVIAVMGPNGAGKSTVLKAIMGLAPVVAGEVWWRESPWRRPPRDCQRGHRIRAPGQTGVHPPDHRREPRDGMPSP